MRVQHKRLSCIPPDILLGAYTIGYFPMAEPGTGEILWYSPDPRAIIDLQEFIVPRSVRQTIRKNLFEVRIDTAFEGVIRGCADREETWISDVIIRSYAELHRLGFAHSVETWSGGRLVGGLYGVALRGAFFGESMFHRMKDASKVALVALVEQLRAHGYSLLDIQFMTEHFRRFGAKEIPRAEYLGLLSEAMKKRCSFL
ncbi:MAG: leucyl/phenylalanyl-tRNA--protein transferase [Bacteroidota bacterium]